MIIQRLFIEQLSGNLNISHKIALDSFLDICKEVLNKTVPLKQIFSRTNNNHFKDIKDNNEKNKVEEQIIKSMFDSTIITVKGLTGETTELKRVVKKL